MTIHEVGLYVAAGGYALRFGLRKDLRLSLFGFVAAKRTLHRVFRGDRQGLRVLLVLDQIGLIVIHVRAVHGSGKGGKRMGNDGQQ